MESIKKLKPLVNNPELWSIFLEYLDELHAQHVQILENQDAEIHVHRTQGYIQAIKHMKGLRNKVNVK